MNLLATLLLCAPALQNSLPTGWSSTDIGAPGQSGSVQQAAGQWTVSGGGTDIWNTADEFHLVSRELRGDGTIVARVDSIGNSAPWAKAGVMVRAGTGASAAYADMVVTPSNGVVFQWRDETGAEAESASAGGAVPAPIWLRLTRSGDEVAGSFSYDGDAWIQVGPSAALALGPTARAGLCVSAGDDSALNTATFSSVGVVPAGWRDVEIGQPPATGSASLDGAAMRIEGSGEIFGAFDQFHFSSQTFVGDVEVVARVEDLVGGGTYAKAGVMVRASEDADAPYAFGFVTPDTSTPGQGANFEARSARGASTVSVASTPGLTAPAWLRLVRRGDSFTAFHSADGTTWVQNGPSATVPMGATVRVGLAVSGGGGTLASARFTDLRVAPPGWISGDVGEPGLSGASLFDGLDWRVSGGGGDVWGTADQFQFARKHWSGDVELVARVKSLSNTANFAKAGLMIREGADADASYAFAFLNPANPQPFSGALMEVRSGAGAASEPAGSALGAAAPDWLKLVRDGDLFTAYRSHDGIQWIQFGSAVVPMAEDVQVGLAVVANDDGALCDATFEGVFVGGTYRSPFLKANGIHFRDHGGAGDVVDLRGTNTGGWLLHEQWLDGMDSSGLPDDLSIRDTLEVRFGRALANRMMATWEEHWITETDLDHMRALGLNVLRVPFSYRCLYDSSWNWRGDALARLDWVVDEAWRRGIYVILDLHGAPGGASSFQSSGQVDGGALWFDWWLQERSVELWSRIAEHFIGHPGVAAYDLINEPVPPSFDAMWSLYDRMYDAIRLLDGDHVVMMEGGGGAGVGFSYWSVDTLPSPASQDWFNVAYQSHAYALDGGSAAESAAHWQVTQLSIHGVPLLVGEFNLGDRQAYGVELWDDNDVNWTNWTYKVRHPLGSSWGIYGVTQWPADANLQFDDAETILAALRTVTTDGHFDLNPALRDIYGTPWLSDDAYQATPGQTLYVDPETGVLANDTVPNAGQPGIEPRAYAVDGPDHGALTLFEDGSFRYTPDAGFTGTDAFRYFVWDTFNDSANRGTVTLEVGALPAPWASSDIGVPGVAGRAEFDRADATWRVHGGGADVFGVFDQLHFVERPLVQDGGLAAHVTAVESTDAFAKAGAMLRASALPDAAYAYVHASPTRVAFDVRGASGGVAATIGSVDVAPPVWVRVTRQGSHATGWWSTDGSTWTALGTSAFSAPQLATAGLAVTSRDNGTLNTSVLRGVLASPITPQLLTAAAGDARVRLRWQPSPGATAYSVRRATSASGPFTEVGTAARATFVDTGLQNGTLYHYEVTARNAAGESSPALSVDARPLWSESDWRQTPSSNIRTAR